MRTISRALAGAALFAALVSFAPRASAQFLGYTSPQTTSQVVANAVTCPAAGTSATVAVTNIGQTSHFVSWTSTATPSQINVFIQATDGVSALQNISDMGTGSTGILTANGYYPVIKVNYFCKGNGGTFTLNYFGVSSTAVPTTGQQDATAYLKLLTAANTGAAFQNFIVPTPYGTSCGQIQFNNVVNVAGTTFNVTTTDIGGTTIALTPTITAPNTGSVDVDVPCQPAQNVVVNVTPGGAGNFAIQYYFYKPGAAPPMFLYQNITGTTATAVKATGGNLHTLTVNTGGAGTVTIFDLAAAACTGTPSTNKIATITATAATLQTFRYDVTAINGICVKASVAMDLTASYR